MKPRKKEFLIKDTLDDRLQHQREFYCLSDNNWSCDRGSHPGEVECCVMKTLACFRWRVSAWSIQAKVFILKLHSTFVELAPETIKANILIALTCSTRLRISIHKISFYDWNEMNGRKKGVSCMLLFGYWAFFKPRSRSCIWCFTQAKRREREANKQTNKLTRLFLVSFHYAKHTKPIEPRSCAALSRRRISSTRGFIFLHSSSFSSWCFNL